MIQFSANKKRILMIMVICFAVFILFRLSFHATRDEGLESSDPNTQVQANDISKEVLQGNTDSDTAKIRLTFLGDIMCHPTQYEAAWNGDNYNFSPSFTEISAYTSSADLTLANLETTLAGKSMMYGGYPSFNTPEQIAYAIKHTLGVDILSTANNHSLDRHYRGLCNTIDYLQQYGIAHTGTFKTEEDSEKILLINSKDITIAFLSYTYGTNGITLPPDKSFAVNYINRDKIKSDAKKAKESGADLVIASIHWGQEYSNIPSKEQTDLAKWLFTNTEVDLISGNHVHTIQPIEFIPVIKADTGETKEGLVVYAQGNFVSDQKVDSSNMGIIVNISIDYNKIHKKFSISNVKYFACWVDETPGAGAKTYRVLNLEKALSDYVNGTDPLLSQEDYQEMQTFKQLVQRIIPEHPRIKYNNVMPLQKT